MGGKRTGLGEPQAPTKTNPRARSQPFRLLSSLKEKACSTGHSRAACRFWVTAAVGPDALCNAWGTSVHIEIHTLGSLRRKIVGKGGYRRTEVAALPHHHVTGRAGDRGNEVGFGEWATAPSGEYGLLFCSSSLPFFKFALFGSWGRRRLGNNEAPHGFSEDSCAGMGPWPAGIWPDNN